MNTFGNRLSEYRKDKGLTQKELAAILNISEDMLSSYERGISAMPDNVKFKLATHFNITLDYFFGLVDKELPCKPKNALYLPKGFTQDAIDKAKHYLYLLELELKNAKTIKTEEQE